MITWSTLLNILIGETYLKISLVKNQQTNEKAIHLMKELQKVRS
jgi:hypothetical protein